MEHEMLLAKPRRPYFIESVWQCLESHVQTSFEVSPYYMQKARI
jgi:hypothetical protein